MQTYDVKKRHCAVPASNGTSIVVVLRCGPLQSRHGFSLRHSFMNSGKLKMEQSILYGGGDNGNRHCRTKQGKEDAYESLGFRFHLA
jgi:hypothetical protein